MFQPIPNFYFILCVVLLENPNVSIQLTHRGKKIGKHFNDQLKKAKV